MSTSLAQCWDGMWSEPVQNRGCCHRLCEFVCAGVSERLFIWHCPPLLAVRILGSPLAKFPEPGEAPT